MTPPPVGSLLALILALAGTIATTLAHAQNPAAPGPAAPAASVPAPAGDDLPRTLPETKVTAQSLDFETDDKVARFTFTGEVRVIATNLELSCDQLAILTEREGEKDGDIGRIGRIREVVASGNVTLIQAGRRATAGRAELRPIEGEVILTEDPVLRDPQGVLAGTRIRLQRGIRRATVENPRIELQELPDLGYGREGGAAPAPGTPGSPAQDPPAAPAPAPASPLP